MLVIGLGTLIVPLDRAVNIAFPDITTDFSIAISDIQWVVLSYVLTYAALMLVFGKLGDMFGHRRIFLIGLALSAVAFIACALAPAFHWLLLARLLQGIGAALVLSCGPALATALFPESRCAGSGCLYHDVRDRRCSRPVPWRIYGSDLGMGSCLLVPLANLVSRTSNPALAA